MRINKNMGITLNLSKKQFKELLLDVMVGTYVRGGVADALEQDWQKFEKLTDYLLEQAKVAGFDDLTENFKGHLLPSDELCEAEEEIMEIYDDDEFWYQLGLCLGQRDFERQKTKEDEKHMEENNGWFPEKIHEIYDKYEKEFETHGLERLEIVKDNIFILDDKK